jgi:transposase
MTPTAAKMRGSLAVALSDGENVRTVWLPPYCPELNSIERV